MSGYLEIVDNGEGVLPPVKGSVDGVAVSGVKNGDFDEDTFLRRIAAIKEKNRIHHVLIKPSSHLRDCALLQHFVNAQSLTIQGKRMESVAGVRYAPNIEKVIVNTGTSNRMAIGELSSSKVQYLRVQGVRRIDLRDITQCGSVQRLELVSGELVEFKQLRGMALRELAIIQGQICEIGDIDSLGSVESLWLTTCKSLTGFTNDCKKIRELTIEGCNKFDARTLHYLKSVKVIRIINCKWPIELGVFTKISTLRELMISNCKVTPGNLTFSSTDVLKKLWISPLNEERIRQISESNKKLMVCNGTHLYMGGQRQPDMQMYYVSTQ